MDFGEEALRRLTRRRIGLLTLLASLVLVGAALAGSPSQTQYGGGQPPPGDGPELPFTGFQAGAAAAAGLLLVVSGALLRRAGRGQRGGRSRALWRGLEEAGAPLEVRAFRCAGCGRTYDPLEYSLLGTDRPGSYHSLQCLQSARDRERAARIPSALAAPAAA